MQSKATEKRVLKTPSRNRRAVKQGENNSRADGDIQGGENDPATFERGLHFLTKDLRSYSLFEIDYMRGSNEKGTRAMLELISSPEKMLNAILDLYLIFKAQPKYKALEPTWKPDTPPIRVLTYLVKKLGALAAGNPWSVDSYRLGGKTRFRFVAYKPYSKLDVKDDWYYLPLDFLPMLRKRDPALHDMIIDAVALISKNCGVALWDEDGDFSEALDFIIKKCNANSTETIQNQRFVYMNVAAAYLKKIKSRRRIIRPEDLVRQIKAYDRKSYRRSSAIWWLEQALDLKGEFSNSTWVPGHWPDRDKALTPFRNYKFVWGLHKNDLVSVRAKDKSRKEAKAFGDFMPVMISSAGPGQILKPIQDDGFIPSLSGFMEAGFSHLIGRYRKYYYKNIMEEQSPPSQHLIDVLEIDEIKNFKL